MFDELLLLYPDEPPPDEAGFLYVGEEPLLLVDEPLLLVVETVRLVRFPTDIDPRIVPPPEVLLMPVRPDEPDGPAEAPAYVWPFSVCALGP